VVKVCLARCPVASENSGVGGWSPLPIGRRNDDRYRPELKASGPISCIDAPGKGPTPQQIRLAISSAGRTTQDQNLQIVFCSPERLSIELTDKVEYDVKVLDHGNIKSVQHVNARYFIVLTPAEVRWSVRVFQAVQR
jgi:hypothetical protein